MKNNYRWLKFSLPVIVFLGVIFFFSSLPGNPQASQNLRIFIERKSAHIAEFAVLWFLLIRCLRGYELKERQAFYWATLLSVTFAFSDEIHQVFVFGREGRLRDVGFDSLGILMSMGIIYFSKIKILINKKVRKKYGIKK